MINPSSGPGGVCRLLTSLLYGLESHMDTSEDSTFLQDMLMGNTLHLLIKVYDRLQKYRVQRPAPLLESTQGLAQDLAEELRCVVASPETTELLYLLSKPHVQALLSVHDMVSQKEFDPRLPPLPPLPDYIEKEEDSIKIVRLVKNQEPLGATIKRDESTGAIVVARVMRGGAADRSGLIHEGDKLKEVNGVPMEDKNPEEIIPILAKSEGAVTFKVIPGTKEEPETIDNKIFVRALFDYNPQEDPAIPCKDAGLEFWRGDVLQIVSQEDDTWWQARRHGDANLRAGLIPSRQLQERRVTLQRPAVLFHPLRESVIFSDSMEEDVDYGAISGIHIAGLRKSFRLSRKDSTGQHLRQKMGKGHAGIHLPIYQEVLPYKRKPGEPYRLVLLTARFLEYGEYKGNYYGMSLDSVHRVVAESKVCLLVVKPHAIIALYTSELKPYVVFVKPPSIESLRLSRRKAKVLSSQNEQTPTKIFTEEDFQDMITSAQAMENKYGHLFEKVIINDDLAMAFTELRDELTKIETETHWIPNTWAHV
ncbi:MAGUK p55 subfamily member 7 [Sinocyclocheilus grahami]|uniref:MAGUK p55 subfamily member 7 n=1 Tax=Sinocyclocheilus grahami TaxID=75366 RepID=UPI0007ACB542|nr:PREDICTED: MAGUK p55 subfamily member 7-like [Sinocyclocheilus grahami]